MSVIFPEHKGLNLPKLADEYVHRVGRTGRAGNKGQAISFVGPKDWYSFLAIKGFLQQDIEFSEYEGLTAKFKGLKAKKAKVTQLKTKADSSLNNKPSKVKKSTKKVFHAAQDVGDMPIIKRKKPLSAQQLEDSNFDEVD